MIWITTALLLLSWPALGHLYWLLLAVAAGPHPHTVRVEFRLIGRLGRHVMADDDRMALTWTACVMSGPLACVVVPFMFWLFTDEE